MQCRTAAGASEVASTDTSLSSRRKTHLFTKGSPTIALIAAFAFVLSSLYCLLPPVSHADCESAHRGDHSESHKTPGDSERPFCCSTLRDAEFLKSRKFSTPVEIGPAVLYFASAFGTERVEPRLSSPLTLRDPPLLWPQVAFGDFAFSIHAPPA